MPNHALYYPDWDISDPVSPDFNPRPWHADEGMRNAMAEAHERYVSYLEPSEEQKGRVHQRVEEIFAHQIPPEWCRPANLKPERSQKFSAYKFFPQTVELLRNSGWASPMQGGDSHELQVIADSAANILLSVLANEMSSDTMPPITDDPGSFVAGCNSLLAEMGSPAGLTWKPIRPGQPMPMMEGELGFLLASIPCFGFEPGAFDAGAFRKILKMRNDPGIDGMRGSFRQKVDEYLGKLRNTAGGERELIAQEFQSDFEADRTLLRRELKRCGLDTIVSKEGLVGVVVVIATGALISPGLGLAFRLAEGLLGYRQKRREVFEKHWSSWVASNPADRFSIW